MEINCAFSLVFSDDKNFEYTCVVFAQNIPQQVDKSFFNAKNSPGETNNKVKCLMIDKVNFSNGKIPKDVGKVFPALTRLIFKDCNLTFIVADDLKQFPHLTSLDLSGNKIESLPGKLFKFNKKVQKIDFSRNRIREIASTIFAGIENLENVNFRNNSGINYWFKKNDPQSMTLKALEAEIQKKWFIKIRRDEKKRKALKEIETSKINAAKNSSNLPQNMLQHLPQTSSQKLPSQPPQSCTQKLHKDIEKFLLNSKFKDFKIFIVSKNAKVHVMVHKFIFMARSETFAEMIGNNPDAEELILTDIPVEIFEVVLDYIYSDSIPNDKFKAREIFVAAGKLKIEGLKSVAEDILINEMDTNDDLDFLMDNFNLGYKFECPKLKLKAFKEIKKHFPGAKLGFELLEEPQSLKTLVDAKKKSNEAKRLIDEEMKELQRQIGGVGI